MPRYRAIVERTVEYSVVVYAADREDAEDKIREGEAYMEEMQGGLLHEKITMGPFLELDMEEEGA